MLLQQTDEWLEFRKNKIGASDAPIIMGVSPWKTPYQLWEEKLGLRENRTSASMARGIEMEEEARKAFEKEMGFLVFPLVKVHTDNDWMMASLDGIDMEEKHIVEIKCPGKIDHECAMDGVIPEKYFPQLQHQMIVCDLPRAYYFSYSPSSYKILEIERDRDYENKLIKEEKQFWKQLYEIEAPSLTERDYVERSDEIWEHVAQEWKSLHSQLETLKEQEEQLRQSLIHMASDSNCKGHGVKISKVLRKGAVDYKSIPELQSMNLEAYRKKPVQSWRIGTY